MNSLYIISILADVTIAGMRQGAVYNVSNNFWGEVVRAFRPGREHPALYGISAQRISEICKVHVTSARRWKRGEEPPHAALTLIALLNDGDLGVIDPAWSGWRIKNGRLFGPSDADGATPGEVMALPWQRRIIASYQRDARLPRQADWIDGKWETAKELEEAHS